MIICIDCNIPYLFFFFNDTATTEIYTLSLHDALPILTGWPRLLDLHDVGLFALQEVVDLLHVLVGQDRKSTRLNSSHQIISYAVFCLKKKELIHQQNDEKGKA